MSGLKLFLFFFFTDNAATSDKILTLSVTFMHEIISDQLKHQGNNYLRQINPRNTT